MPMTETLSDETLRGHAESGREAEEFKAQVRRELKDLEAEEKAALAGFRDRRIELMEKLREWSSAADQGRLAGETLDRRRRDREQARREELKRAGDLRIAADNQERLAGQHARHAAQQRQLGRHDEADQNQAEADRLMADAEEKRTAADELESQESATSS